MLQGWLGVNLSLGPDCHLLGVSTGEEKRNRVKGGSSGVIPSVYKGTRPSIENRKSPL